MLHSCHFTKKDTYAPATTKEENSLRWLRWRCWAFLR